MIKRIAINSADTVVTKVNGATEKIKFLNYLASGVKLLKMDQQAVSTPNSSIIPGDILTDPFGVKYTVVDVTPEFYRKEKIRTFLTFITANNAVTVRRATVTANLQGGISGHTDLDVHIAVPCKIGTVSSLANKELDVNLEKFVCLLSKLYPVKLGDTIKFASNYSDAKVEGIKYDLSGVQEIFFDKDPRWKST